MSAVHVRLVKSVAPQYLGGVNPHWSLNSRSRLLTLYIKKEVDGKQVSLAGRELYDALVALGAECRNSKFDEFELDTTFKNVKNCLAFAKGFYSSKVTNKPKKSFTVADKFKQEFEELNKHLYFMRDLVNCAPDVLYPEELAKHVQAHLEATAKAVGKGKALKFKLTKGEELLKAGYVGTYTVGKGSERPPVLLEVDFNPTGKADAPVYVALVGKGITFDTGGYSLKPSASMLTMRSDMGGAALVSTTLALAVQQGLDKRVKLYLACAENMVSHNAFRVGDVIHYPNGVTVNVDNTDAEGRLVLADALQLASKADNGKRPALVLDAATLTGAAKIAVATDYHSLLSMDDNLVDSLTKVAKNYYERFWRLPFEEFHRGLISSPVADITNAATSGPGASTAAAFLSYFVDDYKKGWLHIDASSTFNPSAGSLAYGATGNGALTLASFLLSQVKNKN